MKAIDKRARIAGAIYLSMILVAPFAMIYVPNRLFVRGDATATATNVLAHETLFRLGIGAGVIAHVIFIALAFALYRLLSDVNRFWAQVMVALVLISATIGLANTANHFAALTLFRGGQFLDAVDSTQRNALGMFFIRLHWQGDLVNEVFWGAWLFPFGLLVYRCGFLPRFIGGWLIANCFAWLVLCWIGLFAVDHYNLALKLAQPFFFAEIVIMLWLLIRGAKPTFWNATDRSTLPRLSLPVLF